MVQKILNRNKEIQQQVNQQAKHQAPKPNSEQTQIGADKMNNNMKNGKAIQSRSIIQNYKNNLTNQSMNKNQEEYRIIEQKEENNKQRIKNDFYINILIYFFHFILLYFFFIEELLILHNMRDTNQKKGRFLTIEDNVKIVELIKAKINPMHKKLCRPLPKTMYESAPNFYRKKKIQYEIIDEKQLKPFELLNREAPIQLVRKTKQYVEQKRKNINNQDRPIQTITNLKMFVKLFDGTVENKQNAIVNQFLKMKRQSLQMLTFYDKPTIRQVDQPVQYDQKTQQQSSELNARIRRRMNHRKLISLYKY